MSGGQRWLWITAEITEDPVNGGELYSMELAAAVARAGQHVTMVGLGTGDQHLDGIDAHAVDEPLRPGWRGLVSTLPHMVVACSTAGVRRAVAQLLAQRWDVVVLDHLRAAWALNDVAARHRGVTVFVAHNHDATFRRQVAREAPWHNGKRLLLSLDVAKIIRLERRTAAFADVVTAITEADRRLFLADAPDSSHVVVAPGWSGTAPAVPTPVDRRPRRVGIVGSFDWHVKQENLRRFLPVADPVFERTGIELVIGGKVPEPLRRDLEPGLRATRFAGWVGDLAGFLGECRIGVIAEPLGGGFKLKSLDYVFNGAVVAALRGGAAGLPLESGTGMLEAADIAQLVATITATIDDTETLQQLADEALVRCRRTFSWDASAALLIERVATRADIGHNG